MHRAGAKLASRGGNGLLIRISPPKRGNSLSRFARSQAAIRMLAHRGHPEAVAHAVITALGRASARAHGVAFDPSRGFQLIAISPGT